MLMSIDPGINNCGVAIIEPNKTNVLNVTYLLNIAGNRKFTPEEKKMEEVYGTRVVKVANILSTLDALVKLHNVKIITVEAPFYNALTPAAYGALVEVVSAIKHCIAIPNSCSYSVTEPLRIKKLFIQEKLTNAKTKKDVMRYFMNKLVNEKVITVPKTVEEMTEHEIDAVAIGYAFYSRS